MLVLNTKLVYRTRSANHNTKDETRLQVSICKWYSTKHQTRLQISICKWYNTKHESRLQVSICNC